MMLGKRKQTTAPWKKGTLKKWPKKKRSQQFGPGYNPKVVSARPPPPNTMHHHQSLYMQP